MSKGRFGAQAAKTFSVQLYNPTTLAALGAAIAGVTDATVPTLYEFTTTTTGIVYMVATATNLRVAGYVDLSNPDATGSSPTVDTYEEAAGTATDLTSVNTKLDAIKLKTDLIVTGQITIQSPVNEDGSVNPIVIGDDYLAAHDRSFDFFIDPVTGVDPTTASCFFGGERENKGSWLVTGTVAVVDTKWRMRFELASDDTIDCLKGCYEWSAELRPAESKRITRITGEVELVRSQTIP